MRQLIRVRPNGNDGLWLGFILPLAVSLSIIKHNVESSEIYRNCAVLIIGIVYITIAFIWRYSKNGDVSLGYKTFLFPAITVSLIFFTAFHKNVVFCCFSGVVSSVIFYKTYLFILKNFPLCFTFGEALFCAQGATLFTYSCIINIVKTVHVVPVTSLQIATLIIQVGLLSIALICFTTYKLKYFWIARSFYPFTAFIVVFVLLMPLHLLLRQSPLLWIYNLFTKDISTVTMLIYWIICCGFAMYAVSRQIKRAKKASTVIRKIFHVLAVLVFLPGLLYECTIVYLASGVTMGFFVMLELLRNINIPPLGAALQDGFMVFSDEKDIGSVALTPMYLLIGCALPLWIHPAPCDLTDSAAFTLLPLLSGLLSIGVGDAMASYVGTVFGRHKWSGLNKTIEGTLGCVVGQFSVIYLLLEFNLITLRQYDVAKILVGVIVVGLVEAKTTQVDNLVLPLLMYCIFLI